MTGSNRSPAPLNGVPRQWGTPEGDGQAHGQGGDQVLGPGAGHAPAQGPALGYPPQRPGEALSRWVPPQQAYAQQQPQFQPQHPGYAQPNAAPNAHAASYGQQPAPFGGYPPQNPQNPAQHQPLSQAGYSGQYDRFAPPPAAAQHDQYQPHAHQPADPHALGFPADPRRGYDQQQQQPVGHGHHQPQPQAQGYGQAGAAQAGASAGDVQNWDLAHYAPGQPLPGQNAGPHANQHTNQHSGQHYPAFDNAPHDPRYAQQAPQYGAPGGAQPGGQHPAWQGNPAHGEAAYNLDHYAQPNQTHGYAPQQDHGQPGYDAQNYGPQDQGEQHPDQDFAYDEEPVAEKRRGPRIMMVAGALVGVMVVGGGLMAGYKMIGGNGKDAGKPPLVKAATSPTKTKPSDAGGKDVAYTDKKFLNRLEGPAGSATVTTAGDVITPPPANDPDAPKKVQTVVVNRDGTITPQMQAPAQPAPVTSGGIPGMVVDGGPPVNQQRPPLRGATAASDPQPATPISRQAPKVADLPLPKVKAADPAQSADAPPVPVKKKVAARDDLKAGSTTTTASTGGSGTYVAALISTKTREEALKTFANLHQTYSDLQGKVPDVREVDRGEKGIWQRLVVGPPGSKEAASDLCKKLKSQGLKDCWVTAY